MIIDIEIELDRKVSNKRKREIEEIAKQLLSKLNLEIVDMKWVRR